MIRDLADAHGVGIGVVLHDLDQAAAIADRLLLLEEGRVTSLPVELGATKSLSAMFGRPSRFRSCWRSV